MKECFQGCMNYSLLGAQAEWALGARGNLLAKVCTGRWKSDCGRLQCLQNQSTYSAFHSLYFLCPVSCQKGTEGHWLLSPRDPGEFPTLQQNRTRSLHCLCLLHELVANTDTHFSKPHTHLVVHSGGLSVSRPSFPNLSICVLVLIGLRKQCLCLKLKGLGSLKNSGVIIQRV